MVLEFDLDTAELFDKFSESSSRTTKPQGYIVAHPTTTTRPSFSVTFSQDLFLADLLPLREQLEYSTRRRMGSNLPVCFSCKSIVR